MYEERFGLKSNPFRTNAEGASVFVGPSQAKVISRIHKALSAADNIVTVSGPVGVGKTTIVTRALETNKQNQLVAWIGRMRLAADEVLQLLLAGFGITRQVPGTVRQFAVFQRLLNERAAADTRVVIVIEDALRIGTEALLELEAITATDTGNAGGANIILMGPPEIDKRLMFPELARLKQRSRLGQKIVALDASEVRGYLKHCLRVAGKEYDDLFDDDVASMLYRLSEGIPRVINNICDAALTEADEENHNRITRQLVLAVAADVYGLEPMLDEPSSIAEVEMPDAVVEKVVDIEPEIATQPEPDIEPEPEAAPEAAVIDEPEAEPESDPDPVPVSAFDPEPAPVSVSKVDPEPEREFQLTTDDTASMPALDLPPIVAAALAQEQEEITAKPALINITGLQPQLETEDLPVEEAITKAAEPSAESLEPESFNDTADDLPMLSNSMRIDGPITPAPLDTESEISEGVASPEPAKKQNIPDLDALEAAITAARGDQHIDKTDTYLPELNSEPSEPVIKPELAVSPQIEAEPEAEILPEPAPQAEPEATPEPVTEPEPEPEPKLEFEPMPEAEPEAVFEEEPAAEEAEVPEITLDNSIDQTLEDQRVDRGKLDKMTAELAAVDSLEDISDIMAETLFGIEFEHIAQEALKNPPAAGTLPGDTDVLPSDVLTSSTTPANDPGEDPSPVMLDPESQEQDTSPTISVPAINMAPPSDKPAAKVSEPSADPESIENQFQTEITQTMKTIDPANLPNPELDGDDEKPAGLLGRLKKTFRG
jgi:type II secretory pathway predicted ATPase ExeA